MRSRRSARPIPKARKPNLTRYSEKGLTTFVPREIVEAAVETGLFEFPPLPGVTYHGFVDPSGGQARFNDVAIAHGRAMGLVVLDYIGEKRPPFDPDAVCAEFAEVLSRYGLREVTGDRYAGIWPSTDLPSRRGTPSSICRRSRTSRSSISNCCRCLMARRVQLLDNKRLIAQLCGLERHTGRLGKDVVDHQPGSFDDVSNSAAGAIVLAAAVPDVLEVWAAIGAGGDDRPVRGMGQCACARACICSRRRTMRVPGLLTSVGEPVVVVRLPRLIGLSMNDATARTMMLPAGKPLQLPTRLLDAEDRPLRDGLRVCKVEYVASDAEIAA